MDDLITKKEEYIHYTNNLTREMDAYLRTSNEYMSTYIYNDIPDKGKFYAIRYPGATRGHIEVGKDNVIKDIKLYDDEYHTDDIYKDNVRDCFNKYIGMKIVFE